MVENAKGSLAHKKYDFQMSNQYTDVQQTLLNTAVNIPKGEYQRCF